MLFRYKRSKKTNGTMRGQTGAERAQLLQQSASRWIQTNLVFATPARGNTGPGASPRMCDTETDRGKGREQTEDLNSQRVCSDKAAGPVVRGNTQPDQRMSRGRAAEPTVEAIEQSKTERRQHADVRSAESTAETEEPVEDNGPLCMGGAGAAETMDQQKRTVQTTESATQVKIGRAHV